MSEKLDQVVQQITELTETVKGRFGSDPTIDRETVISVMTELLKEQKEAILSGIPNRPGAFQNNATARAAENVTGKYAHAVREIVEHGGAKVGNWQLRGSHLVMAKMFIDRLNELKAGGHKFEGAEKVRPASDDLNMAAKALSSTGTGTGDELVPTGMASELWQDFFAASRIVKDLPTQPMPTDPFDMPLGLGDVTWRKGTQNQATTASNPATAKSILTTTELLTEVNWSYNLDEDSVVAMMPALQARLALSGGEQMDAFALNADATNAATGNINLDDANPDDDSYYLSEGQDGIRHLAIVDNTAQVVNAGGDALVDADLTGVLALLGKYGLDINNCRIVPGIAAYFGMLGLTNVATFDKYGPAATILTGELAKYRGVPVIPSVSMEKVEADGKKSTTAGNNTLGAIAAYNRNMWRAGTRRGLLFEVDRNIQSRQLIMVVSFRLAIAAHGTRASATHTALVRNILV